MTKLIISTDRPDLSQLELHKRRKDFEFYLERTGLKNDVCEGVWEGGREQSYMITLRDDKYYRPLLELAFDRFGQDAVLKVGAYKGATFIHRDYSELSVDGNFIKTTEKPPVGDYTQRYSDGAFFYISQH